MPLQVHPVALADFDDFDKFTEENGGTLVTPLTNVLWPVSTIADADRRNRWSTAQQRAQFLNDKTARFVKVIDTDLEPSDQTIALARWHYYPDGLQDPGAGLDVDTLAQPGQKPNFPEGLQAEKRIEILDTLAEYRRKWGLTLNPCWVLITIVTRSGHRRRGAGNLLIKWGVDQAAATNCLAFLDSAPAAQFIYEKHGFVAHTVIKSNTMANGLVQMYRLPPSRSVNDPVFDSQT